MIERCRTECFSEQKLDKRILSEVIALAEQAARGGMKAVPGKEWGLHYPGGMEKVSTTLQGLLDGTYQPEQVAESLKPDALIFKAQDIETDGAEVVSAKINEITLYHQFLDYVRYAEFVASMKGKNIPLAELQVAYDGMVRARVQKRVYDSYGKSGQFRMRQAFANELEKIESSFAITSQVNRVLAALKQNWLEGSIGIGDPSSRAVLEKLLQENEFELYSLIKDDYAQYVQTGDEAAYARLIRAIGSQFPKITPPPVEQRQQPSESGQELAEELKKLDYQPGMPGSSDDPAIPKEDSDEYHTPPPGQPGSSQERGGSSQVIFEIQPPMGGYYVQGRKSYYDGDRKVWSKKKQLQPYSSSISGEQRQVISGQLGTALVALPLPKTFAVDAQSLKVAAGTIAIFRDQNGCFYLQADRPTKFSIDFLKEPLLFPERVVAEDRAAMFEGPLSAATDVFLNSLAGDAISRARHIRSFIHAHHYYPGGGDLQMAQSLQHKLRNESTGTTYIKNLDASEYLECYSANTLFCALLRKSGVPARLVVGDRVSGSKKGKSYITDQTGHAWSEVWDGNQWVRFDATPLAKPEDKNQNQNKDKDEDAESAADAQDGAADESQSQQSQQSDQQANSTSQQSQQQDQQSEQRSAQDSELKDGEKQLDQAKQQMQQMGDKQNELRNKISDAESFNDIEELKKEIEKSELLDEMTESLQDSVEAKLEELKDEVADKLQEMVDDGFMEQETMERLLEQMDDATTDALEKIVKDIETEAKQFEMYEEIREAVQPYVDEWWEYFADRLPKEQEVDLDDDSLTRSGAFNRRSVQRYRNLMLGRVKNPRKFDESVKPRFLASIVVDTSGSMSGEKLRQAMLLLVFYNELFSRISQEFGYIRYANYAFADSVVEVKTFDQDYNSPGRYLHSDGTTSTIKVRLMKAIVAQGGTNMLDGVKKSGQDLNAEAEGFPDFVSAMYFVGDGDDTCGNSEKVKKYLQNVDAEHGGFGHHLLSAIMLGPESLRETLANIFGTEATAVAGNFEQLIEQCMLKFEDDILGYLDSMQR
jgi:hypothetical protein